jgi:hypothetical protein
MESRLTIERRYLCSAPCQQGPIAPARLSLLKFRDLNSSESVMLMAVAPQGSVLARGAVV